MTHLEAAGMYRTLRNCTLWIALVLPLPAFAQSADLAARATANKQLFESKDKPASLAIPGTRYTVLRSGPADGSHPTRTSAIQVRYEGSYLDGEMFDTSYGKEADNAAIFPLRALIPGFVSAVMMMKPGDAWLVHIPPAMAYGSVGHPLAGRDLFFKIELLDFAEMPAQPSPVMKVLPGR
jgi:FKBP-type peptidyl-prolyl cis-trans isomerase